MKEGIASKLIGSVLSVGFIVAAFSGLINLLGTIYYSAYLSEWGLSEALFPAPPGWLSLAGYSSFLTIGGYVALFATSGLFLLLILCVSISLLLEIPRMQSVTEKITTWLFANRSKDAKTSFRFEETAQRISLWLNVALWSLLTVLALMAAIFFVDQQGRNYADAEKRRLRNTSSEWTFKMSGGNSLRGHPVRCSTSHCAIFSADTLRIVNTSDIEQIVNTAAGGA